TCSPTSGSPPFSPTTPSPPRPACGWWQRRTSKAAGTTSPPSSPASRRSDGRIIHRRERGERRDNSGWARAAGRTTLCLGDPKRVATGHAMTTRAIGVLAIVFTLLATASVRADVGDPQVRTDHPWYPGELACSTFEALFTAQAELYQRVVGAGPQTDED